jgi:very-short-patch-repair endonuclease
VRLVDGRGISLDRAPVDAEIAQLAGAQRGRVSRAQLLAAGIDRHAIDRRIGGSRLIRIHPGVYAVGHAAEVELGDETAALLTCGPRALLSHRSAATLWGLRAGVARPIHIMLPDGEHGPSPDGVIVHRSTILRRRDARIHQGLPVTSPARALLDIAAGLPPSDVELAFAEGIALKIVSESDVREITSRAGGHPGRAPLAQLTREGAGGSLTESDGEKLLLKLIREAQLPQPRTQYPVLSYKADFAWPALKLIVEVDGYATHSSRAAMTRDRRRDVRLQQAGWTVLRFTTLQVELEPYAVLAQVAHAVLTRAIKAA